MSSNKQKKNLINDGHYLELMDRLHIVICTLNDHCLEHPLSQSDKEIKFQIEYVIGQIWDAYQLVGNKSPE
jgi:formyltetrahydrofolate hydrolase